MGIIITQDTITPWLSRIPKKLRKSAPKTVNKILRYGARVAKKGVSGQISKDLYRNISVMPATATKAGVLASGNTKSITGFPYELWVNRGYSRNGSFRITGRRPFFNNGIQINYGDKRTAANWRMTPRYFTIARMSMQRRLPKELKRLGRFVLK